MTHKHLLVSVLAMACMAGASFCQGGPGGPGGGGGGGGKGGGAPAEPPVSFNTVGGSLTAVVGQPLFGIGVSATSKSGPPTITLTAAPAGIEIINTILFGSAKGIPPHTTVGTNNWTPARDQIGTQILTFTATVPGASASITYSITVLDAPDPVTGLTVISQGGQITAAWQASAAGGVAPVSYLVEACYSTGPRAVGTLCDTIATTPGLSATMPADHTGQFAGPYIFVQITPIDADGARGGTVLRAPTLTQ